MEIIITVIDNGEIISNNLTEVLRNGKHLRYFNSGCPEWTYNNDYNMAFLEAKQEYANEILKARGHVFLNEIYDMIGLSRTKEGNLIGWVTGDYIDFGLDDPSNKDPETRYPLLHFNADKYILDRL